MTRTDIFKAGEAYYQPPEESFNRKHGLNPGDTVIISAGRYPFILPGIVDGITFVGGPGVEIGYMNFVYGSKNYGLVGVTLFDPTKFASGSFGVGDVTYRNVRIKGCAMGLQCITDPDRSHPLNYVNLTIEGCTIDSVQQEAIYAGGAALGGPLINARIINNVINTPGKDGIQVRNTSWMHIEGNKVYRPGAAGTTFHGLGIGIGGVTNGGVIKNNEVTEAGDVAFFNSGQGKYEVTDNVFNSRGPAAIYVKNYESDKENFQKVSSTEIVFQRNKISGAKAIQADRDPNKLPMSIILDSSNQVTGAISIHSSINYNGVTSAPDPEPVEKEVLKKGYWVINSKRYYYTVYTDGTWENLK